MLPISKPLSGGPGADLPPEGVHREGAELLVATGTAGDWPGSSGRDRFCRGVRETQSGASIHRRAACAATCPHTGPLTRAAVAAGTVICTESGCVQIGFLPVRSRR